MGNSSPKGTADSEYIKDLNPANKNPLFKLLNEMVSRVVKKIDNGEYLGERKSKFQPVTIYIDVLPNALLDVSVEPKNKYETTQRIYNLNEDNKDASADTLSSTALIKPDELVSDKDPSFSHSKSSQVDKSRGKNKSAMTFSAAPKRANLDTGNKFFVSNNNLSYNKGPSAGGRHEKSGTTLLSKNLSPANAISFRPNTGNRPSNNLKPAGKQKEIPLTDILSPSNIQEEGAEGTNLREDLTKQAQKRKFLVNCDLEYSLFDLPKSALFCVLSFLMDDYRNLRLVSPLWYFKINEAVDEYLMEMDNQFIKNHMKIMSFHRSYTSLHPFKFGKQVGFRMDRTFVVEPLHILTGKSIVLSYQYKVKSRKNQWYKAEYKFDVVKKGAARSIWIYKEECKYNYDDIKLAFIQPIVPVCEGDNTKIAVNFFNMDGLVDIEAIKWQQPIIYPIPSIPKEIDSNFLEGLDKNRICEVEEYQTEWSQYKYFHKKIAVEFDSFKPQLQYHDTKCAGVDIVTTKSYYKAGYPGIVPKSFSSMGVRIEIVDKKHQITVEVKRNGLFQDLENILHLRVGDDLIFYLTKDDV